ncbi:MAG: AAA family ATPase [Acidimicrobiia bacterium]|nr:AAA family ATPase [Acidimicrobiia bacterium]
MAVSTDQRVLEPTVTSAGWQYRWYVLGVAVAFTVLGLIWTQIRPDTFAAEATLVLEDPTPRGADQLGEVRDFNRYVQDQVQILKSVIVASQAVEVYNAIDDVHDISIDEFERAVDVGNAAGSSIVTISFESDDRFFARDGANAVATAYRDLVATQAQSSIAAALEETDRAVSGTEDRLDEVNDALAVATALRGQAATIDEQITLAVNELLALSDQLAAETDLARALILRAELTDIEQRVRTLELVNRFNTPDAEVAVLEREQAQLIDTRGLLIDQRNRLSVDLEQTGSGISLFLEAPPGEPSTPFGPGRVVPIAALLGLVLGTAGAYLYALTRRVFTSREQPEYILRAPLLTEIPDFSQEKISSQLPVWTEPRSAVAEGFRMGSASLDVGMRDKATQVYNVASATSGSGKSTVTANLALSAARQGGRVLVVDADFGDQALTRIFSFGSDFELSHGLTEVARGRVPLSEAIQTVELGNETSISLLGRGRMPTVAADFFRNATTVEIFEQLREMYDLVFIDGPPMLQIAYGATIARMADAIIAVVAHESQVTELEEMAGRFDFLEVPIAGYVYNKAPLRRMMTETEGSMRDVVGDQGYLSDTRR